jgi:hypothetical protein
MEIPADTIRVMVGGNSLLPQLTLSLTHVTAAGFLSGTPEWAQLLRSRGQAGALESPPTDFGNWGGVTMFNSDPNDVAWHFGLTTEGLDANESDFLTVAMFGLLHIFGFGSSESFQAKVEAGNPLRFTGSEARSVGSPNNPRLALSDPGHWAHGTLSFAGARQQTALMVPVIERGERRYPTVLDRAAMRDVGWTEALPGDANLDRQFDSLDIVAVLQAGKYRTGEVAAWADGDWNGDFRFGQMDIVAALATGVYLTGPYAAVAAAPPSVPIAEAENTSVFTGAYGAGTNSLGADRSAAPGLDHASPLDDFAGSSFGSLSYGNVAQSGLSEEFVLNDITVIGSLAGGGDLGNVDLIYVPEPSTVLLAVLGVLGVIARRWPV